MEKRPHIISNLVTPLDRLFNPKQYGTYSSTSGALHPVQIPALYVPAEMRPLNTDKFTKDDYELLKYIDHKDIRKKWGITSQPEESKKYFEKIDDLLDDDLEDALMKEMVNAHPDIFFPILRRIRLLQQHEDITAYCINFKTYQTDYRGRSGLAALHSLTFETVGVWSSDFEEVTKTDYSPKLVVVEETINNLAEDITRVGSEYNITGKINERAMIRGYAKDKDAVFIVRLKGKDISNHHLSWAHDYWLPDAVVARGDEKDDYRPRAFVAPPEGDIFVGQGRMEKWGPVRKWFMNQKPIMEAYEKQYLIAREKQMLDREELRLFSPEHHRRLAPMDSGLDIIVGSLISQKLSDKT